jgi:hypothetical protein
MDNLIPARAVGVSRRFKTSRAFAQTGGPGIALEKFAARQLHQNLGSPGETDLQVPSAFVPSPGQSSKERRRDFSASRVFPACANSEPRRKLPNGEDGRLLSPVRPSQVHCRTVSPRDTNCLD